MIEIKEDMFRFFVPLTADIKKSGNSDGKLPIKGYASTSDRDRHDDTVIQKGLDISDFLDHGWFNYDHNNEQILGYPDKTATRVDDKGFYVEGYLLEDVPLAKKMWDLSVSLQKVGAPRQLGFSIEGRTLKEDENGMIEKAKVYNVAITPNPVNTNATWDALVKSFSVKPSLKKAASAGYETQLGELNSGASLKKESLEQAFKILANELGGNEDAAKALDILLESLGGMQSINKSELILFFQLTKGITRKQACSLVSELI